ncbi:hypothetical protein CEXT_200881 [Caerostris extrusa]|uniref:Uncharacterized protein n=1 Tax=Caerostris extrusa TaxID=172846 RepID=A0AAV4R837_CAEEX|nr:hypothetical protein CEXT_200881 [Caerostris extrusa]
MRNLSFHVFLNFSSEFLKSQRGAVLAGHPFLFVRNRCVTCPLPLQKRRHSLVRVRFVQLPPEKTVLEVWKKTMIVAVGISDRNSAHRPSTLICWESLRDLPPLEEAPFPRSSTFCSNCLQRKQFLNFGFLKSLGGTVPSILICSKSSRDLPPEEAPFPRSSAFCPIASGENSS